LNIAAIDRNAEFSGSLQDVFDAFDLATDKLPGVECDKDGKEVVYALGKARIVTEIKGDEVPLREVMRHRSEALGRVCFQVFI